MKHFLLSILMACTLCFGAAAKPNLSFLAGQLTLNVIFDYSQGLYTGLNEEELIEMQSGMEEEGDAWRTYWNGEAKKDFESTFLEVLNDKTFDSNLELRCGRYANAAYTVTISIQYVDRRGNTTVEAIFQETKTQNKAAKITVKGKGGRIGSFCNLMKDGMKSCGKSLGKSIRKECN